jgi:hypothetical protein
VLRHDYIPDHFEAVSLANFFQNIEKQVTSFGAGEEGLTMVTAARDEVEIVVTVNSVKTSGHVGIVEDGLRSICDY